MILDTSAYSALQKGDIIITRAINKAQHLYLPVIVIGELRYGFINGSQERKNEDILLKFLANENVSILDITLQTTPHYAELYSHAKRKGKALSANDLWIAALAREHKLPLATLDRDFEALRDLLPPGCTIA